MYTEPIYEEDTVNLGYLNKVLNNETQGNAKTISKHYSTKPTPPYTEGDTWLDGDILYTCIKTRKLGQYNETDWVTESGAKKIAQKKNRIFVSKPSNYRIGDLWILQSDNDHMAGIKGEILNAVQNSIEYNESHWIKDIKYGLVSDINKIAEDLSKVMTNVGELADTVITTYYQEEEPQGKQGDIWYSTNTGKIYRYSTKWDELTDPNIATALENANTAQLTADKKIQTFYSDATPTENIGVGDLWIDLSNNNKLHRFNGTNWIAVYDTRIDNFEENLAQTSETITEIQTDLGSVTSRVNTVETKSTEIEQEIETKFAEQQIKDDSIVQTVTSNYTDLVKKFDDYTPSTKTIEIEKSVTQLQTDTYTKTEINTKLTDGSVTKVNTISGTFDENGMHYEKTGAETATTINEIGVKVDNTKNNEELLFAGYDNEIKETIVRTENLTVRKYLVAGDARIENYAPEGCTGIGVFL